MAAVTTTLTLASGQLSVSYVSDSVTFVVSSFTIINNSAKTALFWVKDIVGNKSRQAILAPGATQSINLPGGQRFALTDTNMSFGASV